MRRGVGVPLYRCPVCGAPVVPSTDRATTVDWGLDTCSGSGHYPLECGVEGQGDMDLVELRRARAHGLRQGGEMAFTRRRQVMMVRRRMRAWLREGALLSERIWEHA